MPSSSLLTNQLVIVGSIGGSSFGTSSNVHHSDISNADLLKSMKVESSTFHFANQPTQSDVELIDQRHKYKYSEVEYVKFLDQK